MSLVWSVVAVLFLGSCLAAQGAVPTPPPYPAWPQTFNSPVVASDFYGGWKGHGYYDASQNVERYDAVLDETQPTVNLTTRIYDYNSHTQYILDSPSGNCFTLPIPSTQSIPSPPLPLELSPLDGNDTINGEFCWKWKVPIYYRSDSVTYVDLFTSAATGLPVRLAGGAIHSYDFTNISLTIPTGAFDIPSNFHCEGPSAGPQAGTIPWTNFTFTAEAYPRLNHLTAPQLVGDLGGDGGQSTVLPTRLDSRNHSRVYIASDDQMFGVTLFGQRVGFYGPVSNAVLLIDGGTESLNYTDASRRYFTQYRRSDGSPQPFFQPPNFPKRHSWTNGGLIVDGATAGNASAGPVMLMLMQVNGGSNGTTHALQITRDVDRSPWEWKTSFFTDTPFHHDDEPGTDGMKCAGTVIHQNGYAYILGYSKGFLWDRNFHLARLPMKNLATGKISGLQYLNWLGEWGTTYKKESMAKLFESDAGCSTIGYHPGLKLYFALTIKVSGYVGIALSKKIEGPYFAQRHVYQFPKAIRDGFIGYCPTAHPQWTPTANSIVLTYVTNGDSHKLRAKTSPNDYIDRFVKIDLSGSFY